MSCSAVIVSVSGELPPAARVVMDTLAGRGVKLVRTHVTPEVFQSLETEPGATWVLTSTTADIAAAAKLGLFSCYVLDDGVAVSDEAAGADVVAHGWGEVNYEILDDYATDGEETRKGAVCRALVVCGSPEPSSATLVGKLASEADYVVACDSGASVCREAGVTPRAFVGDGDSADEGTLVWVHAVVERFISFPPEKYATDLALAIDAARHEAARKGARLELTITCATGGRPDHALAVLGHLLASADVSPRVVEDGFELRVLSPRGASDWELGADAYGCTFSAISLLPGTVISEKGMHWELCEREFDALSDEGISNVITSENAIVSCHAGALAAYLLR